MNARLRRSGPTLRWILAAALGVVLAAALLVSARTRVTSLRYALRDERKQQTVLREEVEMLAVATGVRSAPERLEPRALALGLTYPSHGQVVRLSTAAETAPGVGAGAAR